MGSIFASLAFEGSIPHVSFSRKEESSGPRPLSLASRQVRCQSVLGEALSMRLSPGPSPLYTSKVRKHPELENFVFTSMNNKLELAVAQIFHCSRNINSCVHKAPSLVSLALSPVPSRHFVQFLSFTTKAANRNCWHPSHKTLAVPNACTGSGYLSQR